MDTVESILFLALAFIVGFLDSYLVGVTIHRVRINRDRAASVFWVTFTTATIVLLVAMLLNDSDQSYFRPSVYGLVIGVLSGSAIGASYAATEPAKDDRQTEEPLDPTL